MSVQAREHRKQRLPGKSFSIKYLSGLIAYGMPIIPHDKDANRGGKARRGTGTLNLGNEFVQGLRLPPQDIFKRFPNRRFEANTGAMACNDYVAKHKC